MDDLLQWFQFWFAAQILALAAWPLASRIFSNAPDGGWSFSRTLGLLLSAYLLWLLTFIGATSLHSAWALGAVGIVAIALWGIERNQKPLRKLLAMKSWILWETALYTLLFGAWSYLRGFNPDILGLEKFMDLGFMNSILRGGVMPPLNPWLGGEIINYYYYGHYLAAFFKLISFTANTYAYNLQMSHLLAIGFCHVFVLSAWIYRWMTEQNGSNPAMERVAGVFSGVFVFLIGNFQYVWHMIAKAKEEYWYPNATRYIDATIHEFPLYSFLVNDLHGHVVDIPNSLFSFAVGMLLFRSIRRSKIDFDFNPGLVLQMKGQSSLLGLLLLQSFIVGGCYFTNAWNYPIYLLLTGLWIWVALGLNANESENDDDSSTVLYKMFSAPVLLLTGLASLFLVVFSIVFFLPHWIVFAPIGKGIFLVPAEKSSPLLQYLVLWLVHGLPCVLLWRCIRKTDTSDDQSIRQPIRWFLGCILILFIALITYPEFFYMKDIYPGHLRANTMFKFFYQAWVWSGILCGAAIIYFINREREQGSRLEWVYFVVAVGLLSSGLSYSMIAVRQQFDLKSYRRSIEGVRFLEMRYSDDLAAIRWFNEKVEGQPIILESVGDSYTENARFSSFTGLPTVLNWPVHIWLWNGSFDQSIIPKTAVEKASSVTDSVRQRVDDVKLIYETPNMDEAKRLLRKYSVRYVIVGNAERVKYPALVVDKFKSLGRVAFQKGSTAVFQLD